LLGDSKFCPKCGKEIAPILGGSQAPTGQQPSTPQKQRKQAINGIDNRILIIAIIIVILVLPIFPRTRIVYVNGTTQTVTNTTSFSTSLQVVTQSTQSQVNVYTGSFQYFTNNYYYSYYNNWWNSGCYWWHGHIVCNWGGWGWYNPTYGTTITVSPSDNVVNVIRTQTGYSESLVLVYYNGQQSQTYYNVYVDNLVQNGVSSMPGTTVVTNTVVSTIVSPMTETVPCNQCVPMTVTDYVSILQLLLGF